jgi:hypothetical protein
MWTHLPWHHPKYASSREHLARSTTRAGTIRGLRNWTAAHAQELFVSDSY